MRKSLFFTGLGLLVVFGLAAFFFVESSAANAANYNAQCTGLFQPSTCSGMLTSAQTDAALADIMGVIAFVGLVLLIIGAALSEERPPVPRIQPAVFPTPPPSYVPPSYPPTVPASPPATQEAKAVCPQCFTIYPASIGKYCPKDATELRPAQ